MASCLVCCDAAATVYCCNDDASLCKACSTKIHSANLVAARHTVLPFCVVCNVAPPTVFCRNDDAFLCAACDQEAHAGLLASRHERIPAAAASKEGANKMADEVFAESSSGANSEVAGVKQAEQANEFNDLMSFGTDFGVVPVFSPQSEQQPREESQLFGKDLFDKDGLDIDAAWLDRLDMGFDFSDILADNALPELPIDDAGLVPTMSASFPHDDLSLGNVGAFEEIMPVFNAVPSPAPVAPAVAVAAPAAPARKRKAASRVYEESDEEFDEEEADDDVSDDDDFDLPAAKSRKQSRCIVATRTPEGAGLFFQMPAAVVTVSAAQAAANRAERIAKCREKRKNRKFEKTIRYATRKAYAEVRPRIKGRFVKKEELEAYYATYGRPTPQEVMV